VNDAFLALQKSDIEDLAQGTFDQISRSATNGSHRDFSGEAEQLIGNRPVFSAIFKTQHRR
jgi:hypothetical protein